MVRNTVMITTAIDGDDAWDDVGVNDDDDNNGNEEYNGFDYEKNDENDEKLGLRRPEVTKNL